MRPEWSESDQDDETITLSEHNIALLTSSFSGTLPNSEWRKVRNSFSAPDVSQIRCPRLNLVFKTSTKPEVRSADSERARIQGFVLDPVGPLARVVHALDPESAEGMSAEDAHSAAWDAIKLLGNASGQISKLRRRKILKAVNPDMQDLADEDTFSKAAPDLFGQGFEAKMKGRAKSLKLISASSSSKPHRPPRSFFEGAAPSAPREAAAIPTAGGRHPGGRKTNPRQLPGSSSPDCNRQRPTSTCYSMFSCCILSELNKYTSQKESGTLKGHLTGGSKGRREISTLLQQLAKGDPRSMGLRDSTRLQVYGNLYSLSAPECCRHLLMSRVYFRRRS